MLDTTASSQGSKTTPGAALAAGAGVPSPELENVPLSTPPYVTHLPPPTPRRRRPGATLASPMVVLSRGWLRRHRPAVLVTAAVLGAAVLVVLLAALAYHVTPSTVSEGYELDIEQESENVEVPLGQHIIEKELDTSRPLVVEGSGSVVQPPRPKDFERDEMQARAADGGILVPRLEEEAVPEQTAEVGAVLRDAVRSFRSPSRSRRHRTDDSSVAQSPPIERFGEKPRIPQSLTSKHSPHFSQGALDVASVHRTNEGPLADAVPNVIEVGVSRGGQARGLWKWAALPFDHTYDVELDEIANSVSETIKRAGGTEKPAKYAREYSLDSDVRHQSEVGDTESNSLEADSFQRETPKDSEENVVQTLKEWPLNHRIGQQERLVTVIKIPGVIRRQKRSVRRDTDLHDLNLVQRMRKQHGILDSIFQKNGASSGSDGKSSVVDNAKRFDGRTPFRGKRQMYWGPFYNPHNGFAVEAESVEDYSSEEVSDKDVYHSKSPYSWYYTPHTAHVHSQVYLPYGHPAPHFWPSYQPHPSYYRNEAPIGQPDFYRASSFQDLASTQQHSSHYEETGGEVSSPEETDSRGRQMEKAFQTSVVAPMNISPELFSRAMKSKTPTEFAKHLREISETHKSNLRQSLPDENRWRLEGFTNVLSALDEETGDRPASDSFIAKSSAAAAASENESYVADRPQPPTAKAFQQRSDEMESTEFASEEDTSVRAAEPGLEKLFTADGIIKLINVLPSESIRKIIESLSAETFADLLKGLSKEEIAKIKNGLQPEKLEAIKEMFSPEELEEVKENLGIKSNVTATPEDGRPAMESLKGLSSVQTATTARIESALTSTSGPGAEPVVNPGSLGQRQVEAPATRTRPKLRSSQGSAGSSEEASLEDYSDGRPDASAYAPLTAVPESSTGAAPHLEEETAPEEGARSFLRRNGTGIGLLRPGLLQQTMAAMNSPVATAGMAQMAAQDQRVGREMDMGNPLDAFLASSSQPQPQRQHHADASAAILTILAALAQDVHWIRMRLDESNTTVLGAARSSLLEAELESARRAFLQHTTVSGRGLTPLDRERLAQLPSGLADQLSARRAGKAVSGIAAADSPTGVPADYTGASAVEATASTAYTVSSPGLDATTPKSWAHGQYLLTTKPAVTAPLSNTGIYFPSQPSGSAFENPAMHKTLGGGQMVPLPIHSSGQHVPVCIYGQHYHQQPLQQPPPLPLAAPVWPFQKQAPPQAAAYASAVAIVPQPHLLRPDNADVKDLPVLHHQQNVYNYYTGAGLPWPHATRHQHMQQQQQQQQVLQPVFCGWLPSPPATHSPVHSQAVPFKPYLGWRLDSQAGVGTGDNLQQTAVLHVETIKADEPAVKHPTTARESVLTEKPLMESEPLLARDSHLDEGKSGRGEGLGDSQLHQQPQNQSSPAPHADPTTEQQPAATQQPTEGKHHQNATTARDPCCDGTTGTDAEGEGERAAAAAAASAKHSAEERQRFASEVRPLQGTHSAILSSLPATPAVPVLSSTDGQGARNR